MTLWAQSPDGTNAAGAETRFVICCPDTLLPPTTPPTIRLYINDTTWIAGGITHPNPTLIAYITDSLGINLSPSPSAKNSKPPSMAGTSTSAPTTRPNATSPIKAESPTDSLI